MLEQTYTKLWDFVKFRYPKAETMPTEARDFVLDEVAAYLRAYCAICDIPVTDCCTGRSGGLFYVWAGLAVDTLRYWDAQAAQDADSGGGIEEINPSDLSEIKLGDTTIRRGGQLDGTRTSQFNNQHMPNLDNYIYNYQHCMNQFRKMRW